ncbi:hypothetical protein P171DRAFT_31458 [Karstenula rhodostoma CBS 690.94]|uniref:Uncharacterized protein n=1 Tax=Karstenula rhodostoma CBS 690.94 TaxID=1392251 RepID=A0A9P4PFY8_9PLEO|nr:hypothetical protein P171DRAFT_31458 [Karstenula rhodostoma CBS 690.94]
MYLPTTVALPSSSVEAMRECGRCTSSYTRRGRLLTRSPLPHSPCPVMAVSYAQTQVGVSNTLAPTARAAAQG